MRLSDVLASLSALGVEGSCPVCGHNSWGGVGDEGGDQDVKLVAIDDAGEFLDRPDRPGPPWLGLTCAVLTCRRCGWVSLHSLETLRQALASAP